MTTQKTTTANDTMSHAELLAEYNRLSPTRRNAMFKSKEEALARIALIVPAAPAVEAPPLEAAPEISEVAVVLPVVEEATARKSAKKASKKSAEKFTITRDPKDVRTTRGADLVIKILTANGANPRKENTHARDHFEQMRGNPTVREYLARFPADARRTARQWLYNTIRDGHVKTEA